MYSISILRRFVVVVLGFSVVGAARAGDAKVTHHYAENDGVKIHYATAGDSGPLVVMIHGFPDFWYSWNEQMKALQSSHRVVAMDLRGYNRSDKPKGLEQYSISVLVSDVATVIRDAGESKAVIVGHDWGGMVAWTFAMTKPEMTERLAVLNLPHPKGLNRELANNPDQQRNSQYARNFQQPGAHEKLNAERLTRWVKGEAKRAKYIEAMERSDIKAMLNYYKRNYPRPPYKEDTSEPVRLKMPVLLIHGLADQALLHGALNRTWEWIDGDLTMVTIPGAGHFVHHDRPKLVSGTLKMWLLRDR
ncbi:MAG: alpha/beta hydrolase [Verrucomicrobiota bacterium]|jgi:pimeloyl-ACP methyl ester carboxylesterase|nr:alpha/beta hydrolase [Verrucomicrobiota bacterium]MDP7049101.1 alpha/beta hydrolase [Verrucomicrobiota bacterium]